MDTLIQFLWSVSGVLSGLALVMALLKGSKDDWPDDVA